MQPNGSPWPLKVSVVIITYNQKPYIAQAIESALDQRPPFDYEIVIGDDCSTDGTTEIVEQYARNHPDKIRALPNEFNLGAHRNFLRTWKACRGQYIAALEGDDYWVDPNKLAKQVAFLDGCPECSLCFHKVRVLKQDGLPTIVPMGMKARSSIEDILKENFIPTASTVFRNGLISEPPEWLHQLAFTDWPLHVLHAVHGQLGFIDEVMGAYRVHSGGVWSQRSGPEMLLAKIPFFRYIDAELKFQHHSLISETLFGIFAALAMIHWESGEYGKARRYAWESLRPLPVHRKLRMARFLARFVWPSGFRALRSGWRATVGRTHKERSATEAEW